MGQMYDVGLQAGKKVAEAVDAFIAAEHKGDHDNFDPKNRKELSDGTTVYRWYMKWQPSWFKDEQRFVKVLERFGDEELDEDGDEDYYFDTAYKLVAVGDEGGQDEMCNEAGCDNFDGLYNGCEVIYPCDFSEDSKPAKDVTITRFIVTGREGTDMLSPRTFATEAEAAIFIGKEIATLVRNDYLDDIEEDEVNVADDLAVIEWAEDHDYASSDTYMAGSDWTEYTITKMEIPVTTDELTSKEAA